MTRLHNRTPCSREAVQLYSGAVPWGRQQTRQQWSCRIVQLANRALLGAKLYNRAALGQRRRESETKRRKATSRERLRTRDKRARWVKGHDDEISKSYFIIMFLVCFLNLCFIDILFQDLIKPKLLSPMVVLSRELDCYNFSYFRKHDFLLFILSPFYRRQVELMPNEYHHQMLLEKGFPLI